MKTSLTTFVGLILLSTLAFAQTRNQSEVIKDYANYPYWMEMMQDQNANYFETVDAFNKYWENREITKGSGYNVFKRWEWANRFHIRPDGSRIPRKLIHDQYYSYTQTNRSTAEYEGDWTNVGPILLPDSPNDFWGNGRINALAFHPSDANILYIGAPSGGLWVSEDKGSNWDILTDNIPTLGVSSIVVDYNNPQVLYIGSGDRDAGDAEGLGVYKSMDAGINWVQKNTGMGDATVGRMIQDPEDELTLFAATNSGIYKSTDSAANWTRTLTGNMKEIVFKPNDPSVLYASGTGRFFKSIDNGETWASITSGLPGNAYRAVIGVSEANPEYVYFFATNAQSFMGVYRSTDAGENFVTQSTSPNIMGWTCDGGNGGQAWYDLDMAVDPLNADVIYGGGINCWKSSDGGVSWIMSSNQTGQCDADAVHADLHVLEWNSVDGRLYVGNDGGIWWTDDGGIVWNRITDGLAIGQQYKLGQSRMIDNHTITGYQDNGISTSTAEGWVQSDMYADGMEAAMDISDSTLSYGCMQYGRMFRMVNDKATVMIAGQGVNGITESGYWVTPFAQHESDQNIMYAGYTNLWRTNNLLDEAPSWTKISSGQGSGQVYVVEHSPVNNDIFYFTTTNGNFILSENIQSSNPDYTNLTTMLPQPGQLVLDIEAHPYDPDVVYIVQNQRVYRSADKGQNWENISGSLPAVNMYDIAFYTRNMEEALYVGSNLGVFFKDNSMDDWVHFSEGLPTAIWVSEVEIYYDETNPALDKIKASSYGRGLWDSPPFYNQPTANFVASDTLLPLDCSIDFFDLSEGYPHSWGWTFEGGTPSSSSEANPKGITYAEEGTFEVSLTVTNPAGTDTKTIIGYITVGAAMLPLADFMAEDTAFCSPGIVEFFDQTQGCPNAWLWEIEPEGFTFIDGTDENSQNPIVEFTEATPYTVSLTVTNSAGEDELTIENYIEAGGFLTPYIETFEDISLDGSGWEIENPDNQVSWELFQVGGTEPGSMAAGVDFRNYQSVGERDRLISPPVNLDGVESAWLSFEHAYAKRWDDHTDSLIVYISTDCGVNWTRIFAVGEDGNGSFATHEQTEDFWPEIESDWCLEGWGASCYSIKLEQWVGNADLRFAFETYSNFGNPILIDNIMVDQTVGMEKFNVENNNILIYPNPADNSFTVSLPENQDFEQLTLTNHLGQLIHSISLSKGQNKVEIQRQSDWKHGVYYLSVQGNENSGTTKVIFY